jgi:hypothetical protein
MFVHKKKGLKSFILEMLHIFQLQHNFGTLKVIIIIIIIIVSTTEELLDRKVAAPV